MSSSCPAQSAHIEADVIFADGKTVHFSADARETTFNGSLVLTARAADPMPYGFPFGLGVNFPTATILAGTTYPVALPSEINVDVVYEDSAAEGTMVEPSPSGSIVFSRTTTTGCEPVAGTFDGIQASSDGPNHPFQVHVKGSFHTSTP